VIDAAHYQLGSAHGKEGRDGLRKRLGLKGVTFVYVGRLWWGKGLDPLLDAYGAVQRRSNREVSLLIVGDGPQEAQLQSRCEAEGLRNVAFCGFQQRNQLPAYYAAADALVFPTLGDPWGLVVEEAMACGLPVIVSTSAGEIRSRMTDKQEGLLVPPGDVLALQRAMEEMVSDPALRKRMSGAAARRVTGQCPDRFAAGLEEIVSAVLSAA
jgi:glycosyltransferase involved in cell wall biosynthesis